MITDDDVKKLKKVFVTKQELKDELRYLREDFDASMGRQSRDIKASMETQKKEIIESIGDLLHDSLLPMLDNQEPITKLEKRVSTVA